MSTDDPEDILSDALQTLYDYTPITHSFAGAVFRYVIPPELFHLAKGDSSATASANENDSKTITLTTPTTQAGNWSLHASSIWASSLFVANHLTDLHLDRHIQVLQQKGETHLRILELGACAGLPSILIAKCYSGVEVIASDYPDDELIRALQANVDRNAVSQRCHVVPYAWGNSPKFFQSRRSSNSGCPVNDEPAFDIVLAADTLWNPELHHTFIHTLQLTLRRTANARIYLIAGLHTGRHTLQAFLQAIISTSGFVLEEVVERMVSGHESREWNVESTGGEDDQERRRWVVWMSLKWSPSCISPLEQK
ncbi:hypothetical protein PHLCEN_2v7671 [Hermanssonia centrifuga]|uniref:Nicotinamide N-methyltransferase n=1 Tax=Hermanssonia centrifuga TaxID=98765 RepID=A0A2R6NVV9_9APHY|nr:hypothetical protein PHLCEN_2v7671 [Hermanssonia centrifuga]